MARSKQKRPKSKNPKHQSKKPVSQQNGADDLTLCWQIGRFDWDGPWGVRAFKDNKPNEIITFLKNTFVNWESMTWAELYKASGGRSKGNNSHPIKINELTKGAQKRLKEKKLEDIDELVSIRVDSQKRIFGIRDSRTLKVLWLDPNHEVSKRKK